MGKPFNAGIAASNGVEAVSLASRGFTSCDDGLDGPQGFVPTHAAEPEAAAAWAEPPPGRFLFDDNLYKLHACCHGLHAMIEGLGRAVADLSPEASLTDARVEIRTNPRWLRVCDVKQPRTGLEAKFSYAWSAAMVLGGIDTAAEDTWSDGLAARTDLAEAATRVHVTGDPDISDTATVGTLTTANGQTVPFTHDLAQQLPVADLAKRLQAKATSLLGEGEAGRLWAIVDQVDSTLPARALALGLS